MRIEMHEPMDWGVKVRAVVLRSSSRSRRVRYVRWDSPNALTTLRGGNNNEQDDDGRSVAQGACAMPLAEYEYIIVRYVNTIAVVSFLETVSMCEGDKVQAVSNELLDLVDSRREPKILLDLCNAHFVSSAMLAHLVKLHRKIGEAKGRLKLCGLRPVILDAFKVSGFDRLFEIHPDEISAMKK